MVNVLGKGLTVVIRAEYRLHHDWMAFAAWYSLSKVIPDASIYLVVQKTKSLEKHIFRWAERVGIKKFVVKPPVDGENPLFLAADCVLNTGVGRDHLLVIDASVVALRQPFPEILNLFNSEKKACSQDGQVWYLGGLGKNEGDFVFGFPWYDVADDLSVEAKDERISVFSSYGNGVGRFVGDRWIDKTEYPFPLAERMAGLPMTANESRILKLWKMAQSVFETTSRG